MKQLAVALLVAVWAAGPAAAAGLGDFSAVDIDGKPVALSAYAGKVALVVNTASRCGFTYQYEGLEQLYRQYAARGLVVLGFPSNDFLGQEPGSDKEIKEFCTQQYQVSFPMFSKIKVTGSGMHPLYRWLTDKAAQGQFGGAVSWNFNKFLIGRDGRVLARFDSGVKPGDPRLKAALEAALGSS